MPVSDSTASENCTVSRAPGWKQRSSALNALAKLKHLSAAQRDALEARVKEVLYDADEVFYVKKDAAYAAGRQGLAGALPRLIEALERLEGIRGITYMNHSSTVEV